MVIMFSFRNFSKRKQSVHQSMFYIIKRGLCNHGSLEQR